MWLFETSSLSCSPVSFLHIPGPLVVTGFGKPFKPFNAVASLPMYACYVCGSTATRDRSAISKIVHNTYLGRQTRQTRSRNGLS